jgi:Rieske Fe-S protein
VHATGFLHQERDEQPAALIQCSGAPVPDVQEFPEADIARPHFPVCCTTPQTFSSCPATAARTRPRIECDKLNTCPHEDPHPGTVAAGPPPSGCLRRQVLLGALGLGAVGVLSACGASQSTAAPLPAAAGPATGSATPTAAAPAAGAANLGPATAIPVKGGSVFDKDKVVITQPSAGVYKAFSAVCTHEQCTVGDVDGGTINCYCHGSKFSITDGSVVNGPADKPLATKTVTLTGGTLTVS